MAHKTKKNKTKHNTICITHHYTQASTNNVYKTWALLQTTWGKDEPDIVLCGNRNGHHNTQLRTYRHIIGQHKNLTRLAVVVLINFVFIFIDVLENLYTFLFQSDLFLYFDVVSLHVLYWSDCEFSLMGPRDTVICRSLLCSAERFSL